MKSAKLHRLKISAGCILLVLSTVLSLVSCQFSSFLSPNDGATNVDEGGEAQNPSENGGNETPPPEEEPQKPLFYNRYTGLACDETVSSCRPVSVCIGNFDGKAQKGLSLADILIETPVSRDETRLWAIASDWGSLTDIKNISSAESYMFPSVKPFDTVCVFNGAKEFPTSISALNYASGSLGTYFSSTDGNVSSNGDLLRSAAIEKQFSLKDTAEVLPYRLTDVGQAFTPKGNPISSIHFAYSAKNTVDFSYDAASGTYLRSQGGIPHKDTLNDTQLAFSNVIILFHNVSYYHSESGTSFTLDTVAGGSGFCYTGGGVANVTWSYDEGGSLVFKDDSGELLTLNRGKTYIAIMKITDSTTIVAR